MRRTGGTPNDIEPHKAVASDGVSTEVSRETLRRLGEAAGVSVWTWQVEEDLIHHKGGSRRPGRPPAPLSDMLQRIDPADRRRVKRRLLAAAARGSSGTMQLRSTPETGSRIMSATYFPLDGTVPAR